jgi:hypothetical protein
MKLKKLIEALRSINGRRLAKSVGITLGLALIITTIFVLGRYAPGAPVAIAFALITAFFYFLIQMGEE